MTPNIMKILFTCLLTLSLSACTKDVPPELLSNKQQQKTTEKKEMPDDSIHRNLKQNNSFHSTEEKSETNSGENNEKMSGEGASKYVTEADEADAKYQKSKSEADKKLCIEMQLKAANYLMFDADLPPREKYKPALIRYRRVIELDPKNEEAIANKTQIEEIYKSMGKPIPN